MVFQGIFTRQFNNVIVSLLKKNCQDCVTKLSVQARVLPHKALVGHCYVMNANLRLRIRLGLQRVVCAEIWTTDLRQKFKQH